MKKEKAGTRAQFQRMNRIIIRLKTCKENRATQDELAKFLEVSKKTVQRDIGALVELHGYPIEVRDWQGGGYVLKDPTCQLLLMDVCAREVVSVLMASRCLEQYAGTPFEAPLRTAFLKLSTMMKGMVKISLGNLDEAIRVEERKKEVSAPELFELLAQAIATKMAISFEYMKPTEQDWRQRRVEPYMLYYSSGIWYVVSYDLAAKDWRKFALSRMRATEIIALVSSHGSTEEAQAQADDGMGAFFSTKVEKVRLWLDAKAAWFATQTPWHPSQELEPKSNGSIMTLEVSGTQDIARRVMEWCPDVIVLEPISLKEEIEKKLGIALQRHTKMVFGESHQPSAGIRQRGRQERGVVGDRGGRKVTARR